MVKMGRPKKAAKDRQSHQVAIRFTEAEREQLEKHAAKARLTVSDFIRKKLGLRGEK